MVLKELNVNFSLLTDMKISTVKSRKLLLVLLQTACNVAEYNVMAMLHEITHKTPYSLPEQKPEPNQEERKGPTLTGELAVFTLPIILTTILFSQYFSTQSKTEIITGPPFNL